MQLAQTDSQTNLYDSQIANGNVQYGTASTSDV